MKFNCDWKKEWHDHFCLFPVKVAKKDCRWLETVERKLICEWFCGHYFEYYDYRAK